MPSNDALVFDATSDSLPPASTPGDTGLDVGAVTLPTAVTVIPGSDKVGSAAIDCDAEGNFEATWLAFVAELLCTNTMLSPRFAAVFKTVPSDDKQA